MKAYFLVIGFFMFFSGILFSQSLNSISAKEKKYLQHYFLAEKYKAIDEIKKAQIEYEICTKENPKESAPFFELFKIHLSLGDLELAKEYIMEAKTLYPTNVWYLYALIELYAKTYDFDKQAELWEDLIQIDKSNNMYYVEAIYCYMNLGLFKKALKIVQKAEKNISKNENLTILKSEIYQRENKIERSIEIILNAHNKNPNNLNYLKKLSELYILKSEYILANEVYTKILDIEPENPTALLASFKIFQTQSLLAQEIDVFLKIFNSIRVTKEQKIDILFEIFSDNKKIERYKNHIPIVLDKCILTYPDEVMFYVVLGDYKLLHNDLVGALKNYINAISYGLRDKLVYEKILHINLVNNNLENVIFYSDQAIEYYSFNPIFYYYKAVALIYKSQYKESNKILIRALEYTLDNTTLESEIYALLGDNYNKLGDNEESDKFYDLALSVNPDFILVLNNYSYYLSLRGGGSNLLKAEKMILKCLKLTEDDPQPSYIDTYAWVLFQQGKLSKDVNIQVEKYNLSKKMMNLCFERGGNSSVMYDHYGDVLFELNDLNGAKEKWEEALKKDQGNKQIEKKLNQF